MFNGRGHCGPVDILEEVLEVSLQGSQFVAGEEHCDFDFLFAGVADLNHLHLLVLLEAVLDGLEGAGLVVVQHLLLVKGLDEVLDLIVEVVELRELQVVLLLIGDGEEVHQRSPVTLNGRPEQRAVEHKILLLLLRDEELVIALLEYH